ncbi:MAG TPA: hypothetical protein VG276_17035 [Actinomycetes bacterium]|nr:hypothetical protein [Actinomycetes bacterium]
MPLLDHYVTTLDPSLLGDIDMLYINHLISDWLMADLLLSLPQGSARARTGLPEPGGIAGRARRLVAASRSD